MLTKKTPFQVLGLGAEKVQNLEDNDSSLPQHTYLSPTWHQGKQHLRGHIEICSAKAFTGIA